MAKANKSMTLVDEVIISKFFFIRDQKVMLDRDLAVLNGDRAIEVNIRIIRIYRKLRAMLVNHKDILLKLEKIEKELMKQDSRTEKNEENIEMIFMALRKLLNPPQATRPRIGFKS